MSEGGGISKFAPQLRDPACAGKCEMRKAKFGKGGFGGFKGVGERLILA